MPIYEYKCPSCSHEFEKLMKIDSAAPNCPKCAFPGTERKLSASSFVLKGGGWYKPSPSDSRTDDPWTRPSED